MKKTDQVLMSEMLTQRMSEPGEQRMQYYEEYYIDKKKFPHAIVLNENREIQDGYITYLLAVKYDAVPPVVEVLQGQKVKKVVFGTHIRKTECGWEKCSKKVYRWIYNLKHPVVTGDILKVQTSKGRAYIQVTDIDYAVLEEAGSSCKKVKRHTGQRYQEAE